MILVDGYCMNSALVSASFMQPGRYFGSSGGDTCCGDSPAGPAHPEFARRFRRGEDLHRAVPRTSNPNRQGISRAGPNRLLNLRRTIAPIPSGFPGRVLAGLHAQSGLRSDIMLKRALWPRRFASRPNQLRPS